jgi:hypothetical protein
MRVAVGMNIVVPGELSQKARPYLKNKLREKGLGTWFK